MRFNRYTGISGGERRTVIPELFVRRRFRFNDRPWYLVQQRFCAPAFFRFLFPRLVYARLTSSMIDRRHDLRARRHAARVLRSSERCFDRGKVSCNGCYYSMDTGVNVPQTIFIYYCLLQPRIILARAASGFLFVSRGNCVYMENFIGECLLSIQFWIAGTGIRSRVKSKKCVDQMQFIIGNWFENIVIEMLNILKNILICYGYFEHSFYRYLLLVMLKQYSNTFEC